MAFSGGRFAGQRGVVLILVLIFAALLNLVAATVIQSAGLQARMSGNIALQIELKLIAESVLHELISRPVMVPTAGVVGAPICNAGATDPFCAESSLAALTRVALPAGVVVTYYAVRRDPLVQTLALSATSPGGEPMVRDVDIALYELGAIVENVGAAFGRSHHIVGLAVPLSGDAAWPLYWREPAIDPP
ncbi:MAG: hypothetical protein Hals2KO_30000 [Halioglobus sp.]